MIAGTKNNINQQDRKSSQQRERSVDKEWDGLLTSYHIIDIFYPATSSCIIYNSTSGSHHRQKIIYRKPHQIRIFI
ncbi:hypothetical protein HIH35_005215 [Escherichia coli]|nr:hypothetical protein [Escherichia coli]EFI4364045.1 hypothetical protein [Escherichia coli]EFI9816306.1 hypothetical protein [Escherichia coli]EFJ1163678.1 hypothetical protein [Escherichia coli]TJR46033.1 hypothetical protein C9Z38_26130 [Escherichia coli]